MDEPTKGVDVGAKAEIYAIMGDLAKKGYAIILISSEMPEILGMSDRIVVMCNGRKTGELGKRRSNSGDDPLSWLWRKVQPERGQLNNGKEIFHEKADRFP